MYPLINQYAQFEHKNNIYRHGNVTIRNVLSNSATVSFKICIAVLFTRNQRSATTLLQAKQPINNSFAAAFGF
jgi:hypothetical protein